MKAIVQDQMPASELVSFMEQSHIGYDDIKATAGKLDFSWAATGEETPMFKVFGARYGLDDHAHTQMCQMLDAPAKYMKKWPPELQCAVFNWSKEQVENKELLLRMREDQICRAALSSQYVILDNARVLDVLAATEGRTGLKPFLATYSPDEFWYKMLIGENGQAIAGENLRLGCVVGNSEIGTRSVVVELFTFRSACSNGMIFGGMGVDEAFRQQHRWISQDAFFVELVEAVQNTLGYSARLEELITAAKERKIHELSMTIDKLVENGRFGKVDGERIQEVTLEECLEVSGEATPSDWHLSQGVTRLAGEVKEQNPEKAIELERLGGKIIQQLLEEELVRRA